MENRNEAPWYMAWKDTKPWYKGIAITLSMILIIGVYLAVTEKAFGAEPWEGNPEYFETIPYSESNYPVDEQVDPLPDGVRCYPSCNAADAYKRKFNRGAMGNSRNVRLGRSIRKKLYQQTTRMIEQGKISVVEAAAGDGAWWRYPFSSGRCWAATFMVRTHCRPSRADAEAWHNAWVRTVKVGLVCGGAAVIGTFRGGGGWGALLGATSCGWAKFIDNL